MGSRERARWPWLVLGMLVVEFALLAAWQRNGYWSFSDGVYAESARHFLHGLRPYRDFAAAQPPPVYVVGTLLLAVEDGLASLRAGLAVIDLVTAALVGVCVCRLTGRRWPTVIAAFVAPLLPITLHEHAQLLPETLAAPLLLGGALCCASRSRAAVGGMLLALAAACKVAFVIPGIGVALVSAARGRAVVAFLLSGLVLGLISLAVFGTAVWREVVEAQLQVGRTSLHGVAGLIAQGAWNEFVLIIGAAAGLLLGRDRDPVLMRTLAAAAGAGLLLILTVFKRGSYINVLVVADPPLLALAVCGAFSAWERRPWRPLVVGLATLLAAQSLSLLISPGDPWAANRPGARSGLNWSASPEAIDHSVAAARRCPGRMPYSGSPYVAFLAGRPMPGNQPDLFIIGNAPEDAAFARQAAAARARCPS